MQLREMALTHASFSPFLISVTLLKKPFVVLLLSGLCAVAALLVLESFDEVDIMIINMIQPNHNIKNLYNAPSANKHTGKAYKMVDNSIRN